jgi:hypothetical protein
MSLKTVFYFIPIQPNIQNGHDRTKYCHSCLEYWYLLIAWNMKICSFPRKLLEHLNICPGMFIELEYCSYMLCNQNSEWVIVFKCLMRAMLRWEQVTFNEMMMSVCTRPNTLSWIFIVLGHWINHPWVDMSPLWHIVLILANQSLFLLHNGACILGKQQMSIS